MLNQIAEYLQFAIILAIFSIPFIRPGLLRTKKLSKIAKEFGLDFNKKGEQVGSMFFTFESREMNVISGTYNNKNISISDVDKKKDYSQENFLAHLTQINGKLYPRLSLKEIRNYIKNGQNPTNEKFSREVKYNFGMLVVLSFLGITISYSSFVMLENFNLIAKYIISIAIFLSLTYLGHFAARKTPYKYSGLMAKSEQKSISDVNEEI